MERFIRAFALGLLVLVAGGCRPKAPKFETAKVDRGAVIARVTSTGTLSALITVQVGTQVSGVIQKMNVDFNSPVKKGELIAKIDAQIYQANVEQARANDVAALGNLAKAKAQAVDARRQYNRNKSLRADNLIAQADLDTSESNADAADAAVAAAEGSVAQAKAALHQAEVNLAYTDIYSPTDGTVISRNVDIGQTVAASLQAPVLFTIAQDLKRMQVDTSVPEADVGKLKDGMEATFTVDAYPSERFKGTIRQIRNAAQMVQNVVTYDAVIDVANPDLKLRPGMTANVTVVYAEKQDVLKVPNAALRFRPPPEMLAEVGGGGRAERGDRGERAQGRAPGGPRADGAPRDGAPKDPPTSDRRSVWVLRGAKPERVPVRVGVSDGTTSEIIDGDLQPGDVAITDINSTPGQSANAPPGGMRRMF
jgi:HlyD family secretion protein